MLKSRGKDGFLLATSVGIGYLFLVSFMGGETQYQLGVVVVMLAYVFAVHKTPGRTSEQIDSIYYLGFVFTIASLLTSLLPLSWSDSTIGASKVLGAFSVALSTTLIGIIFKLLLGHLEFSGEESDVTSALAGLSSSINSISSGLQVASEQLDQSARTIAMRSEESANILSTSATTISERLISELEKSLKAQQAQAEILIKEHSKKTNDVIAGYEKATESLLVIADTQVSRIVGELDKSLSIAGSTINEASARLVKIYEPIEQTAVAVIDSLARIKTELDSSVQFDALNTSIQAASESIDRYTGSLSALPEATRGAEASLGMLEKNIAQANSALIKMVEAISTLEAVDVGPAHNAIKNFSKTIDGQAADFFETNVREHAAANELIKQRLDEALDLNKKLVGIINESSSAILANLQHSHAAQ